MSGTDTEDTGWAEAENGVTQRETEGRPAVPSIDPRRHP